MNRLFFYPVALGLVALLFLGCSENSGSKFSLNPEDFQKTIEGEETGLYILQNEQGMEIAITNYGARAVGLLVPDRAGKFGDVITGFKTLDGFIESPEAFHGPVVGTTINAHLLQINADRYTPVDDTLIPLGQHAVVENTPFDFRSPKPIGRDLDQQTNNAQLQHGSGYDHNWVLNTEPGETLHFAARVEEPVSGRVMEIFTEEPGLQFYGGNFFDGGTTGKNGKPHIYRGAMALEPQMFPDAPNQKAFPSIILEPGELYQTQSIYRFSVSD